MDFNNTKMSAQTIRLQQSLAEANRKMIERKAKLGYPIVFGGRDGAVIISDAKDKLSELQESSWWKEHFA
ncbi:MAG: hypothetical protein KBT27_01325 [Prevotellaceae bacterium]|nr:hypothetical protein [Candidatus Faecinaster equi]